MEAGFSDDQHHEEEAGLQTAHHTRQLQSQTSDHQVSDTLKITRSAGAGLADTANRRCFRRETFIAVPSSQLPQTVEEVDLGTPARLGSSEGEMEDKS